MYLSWKKQTTTDFSDQNINDLYNRGFVFTREGKGEMYETRSVRVDLNKFELSSENRRILRKSENLKLETIALPHPSYDWRIAKFGHDFYTQKFGDKIFSANKIKELLTNQEKSNFNLLLEYYYSVIPAKAGIQSSIALDSRFRGNDNGVENKVGYAICYSNNEILHYSYPFYSLTPNTSNLTPNLGISMMTRAIVWAKENNKKYIYLGSVKDRVGLYKFQFSGIEWWDGKKWETNIDELKKILK